MDKIIYVIDKMFPEQGRKIIIPQCPGCGGSHYVNVEFPNSWGACWKFDGNCENPTLKPSVNESSEYMKVDEEHEIPYTRCHFVLTNGVMEFCGDCTHDKAGQNNLPLPDLNGSKVIFDIDFYESAYEVLNP